MTFISITFWSTTFKCDCYLFHHISFTTFKHHHPPPYALPNFFPIFFSLCICLHFLTFLHILLVVFHCYSRVFFCSSSFIVYFWDLTWIYVGMMLRFNCERLLDVTLLHYETKLVVIQSNNIKAIYKFTRFLYIYKLRTTCFLYTCFNMFASLFLWFVCKFTSIDMPICKLHCIVKWNYNSWN
jgi:hypothetical protein